MSTAALFYEGYLTKLTNYIKEHHYSQSVLRNYGLIVRRFLSHVMSKGLVVEAVTVADIDQFIVTLDDNRKRPLTRKSRTTYRAAIHMLMRQIRGQWPCVEEAKTEHEVIRRQLINSYAHWMSDIHGLAAGTRIHRCAEAIQFLTWFSETKENKELSQLDVVDLDAYVGCRGSSMTRRSLATTVSALRGFLRYLYTAGKTSTNFSSLIRGPKIYAFESIPSAFQPDEIEAIVEAATRDRSPQAKRDRAIILLLKIYGMRANEVRKLCLDDIDWRREVILLRRSKTNSHSELPLLPVVASALLDYIQSDRPKTTDREVFIKALAPYGPMGSSHAIGRIIDRYIAIAGLVPKGKKGPHALRHARAVSLLRGNVPLKIIGDVLGHSSHRSTMVYLSLATDDLRAVGLDLPAGGQS